MKYPWISLNLFGHHNKTSKPRQQQFYKMILFYPTLFLLSFLLYNVYSLYLNYKNASALGLPRVVSPITPDNPLWIAFQTIFKTIIRRFPFGAFSFTKHTRLGWEFHDRFHTHVRLGDAWVLVTPTRNWVFVANAEAVTDIFSRGRDFVRPVWMLGNCPLMICRKKC